jgi:hypothetical protein
VTWLLVLMAGLARIANSRMDGSRMVEPKRKSQIIFVCEHGAALSVVSAAYFNKIAQEKHLNLHAIARGVEPQKDLSVSARHGLDADGVSFETQHPQKLSIKDTKSARRVVRSLSCRPGIAQLLRLKPGPMFLPPEPIMPGLVTPFSYTFGNCFSSWNQKRRNKWATQQSWVSMVERTNFFLGPGPACPT